ARYVAHRHLHSFPTRRSSDLSSRLPVSLRGASMVEIPRIISVDDHVVEPPDLWSDRLPSRYQARGPRIERDRARFTYRGGNFARSEEHTSELQSRSDLVCRLL